MSNLGTTIDFLLSPNFDNNRVLLASGFAEFYVANTNTTLNVFSDYYLEDNIGYKVRLDGLGSAKVYINSENDIKVKLYNSENILVRTLDNLKYQSPVVLDEDIYVKTDGSNSTAYIEFNNGFSLTPSISGLTSTGIISYSDVTPISAYDLNKV